MQTDKANEHEKGEPRVGRDVSPILQENNGTEKRQTSNNLHLVQCLVPWPQVPGSPSLNREPLPNHLSFKAVKNYTAYLWNMAINKHSSHRHIVLWIVLWAHTDRALTKIDLKKHVSLLFGQTLLLHLKAFALNTAHHSTTGPRFPSGFYITHTAFFIKAWLIRQVCLLSQRSTLAVNFPRGPRQWLWRAD